MLIRCKNPSQAVVPLVPSPPDPWSCPYLSSHSFLLTLLTFLPPPGITALPFHVQKLSHRHYC